MGLLLLSLAFIINCMVASTPRAVTPSCSRDDIGVDNRFQFWAVLSHFDIWTCAMCHALSLLCLTFKEPVLAVRLHEFDQMTVTWVGIIFSLDTITYTLASMAL